MQKIVLSMDVHDDKKCKKKVMKLASSVSGVDSISLDMKEKKLTIIGNMDPVEIVSKLRKVYRTEVVTIGPAKEPEKPKEKPKEEVQVAKCVWEPYTYPVYYRYYY